ncbi:hypothetical protein D2E26_1370 [Bifidobacterium dolichotidis]|uniref:Uncharacterized protein n=1 Tax=Bifidobacterium dolichotidis TaxID=2306976 RepID=A0A430FP00_9BIFI|nr:hypothetical protein [Bifidobacterium dolichotidis]RSX54570.1 hypothetical protein D2E26_1370 [Bifidobacterium dolichotidis]
MSNTTKTNIKKITALSLSAATLLGAAFASSSAMAGSSNATYNHYYETKRSTGRAPASFEFSNPGTWSKDMLIAKGVANNDPRVYLDGSNSVDGDSLNEKPTDMYDLYGTYDSNYLYLLWEMVNVTDELRPEDASRQKACDDPKYDNPIFIAFDNHVGTHIGNNAKLKKGGTLWDSQNTWDTSKVNITHILGMSNQTSKLSHEHMFIYTGDQGGVYDWTPPCDERTEARRIDGNIADEIIGINGFNTTDSITRNTDECFKEEGNYVNFKNTKHSSNTYDYMYAVKIPLASLGTNAQNMDSVGMDVQVVSSARNFTSPGVQSLPFDRTTIDGAEKYADNLDRTRSMAEISMKTFSVPFASVGGHN